MNRYDRALLVVSGVVVVGGTLVLAGTNTAFADFIASNTRTWGITIVWLGVGVLLIVIGAINPRRKVAKEMLSTAQQLAAAIEQASGLPATAGLDDRLLNSLVIISADPKFRKPGQWFEYLGSEDAKRTFRTTGVVEIVLEVPPREHSIRARLILVRLKQSPMVEREEFVSEVLRPPLSDELQRIFEAIDKTVSNRGYLLHLG